MDLRFLARLQTLAEDRKLDAPVYVTRPNLPSLGDYAARLAPVWERCHITNDGMLHQQLEAALTTRLDAAYLRLFCNGTMALLTALQALELDSGAVVTTPFTFPATVNVLHWNRLRPVFCDIERDTFNMDPRLLEALITPDTRAILPVHVFGRPCDVDAIQTIADRHGLPVLYDAAHAFGVRRSGVSLLRYGAISMLSFHATKLFTTAEGGALAMNGPALHERVKLLKNFGIADEETVIAPGVNGKMSELHAALGLAQLDTVDREIEARRRIARLYRDELADVPGISWPAPAPDVEENGAYFPVRIREQEYGLCRDALYAHLKDFNIHCRKYFYPLCSTYHWCRVESGALPEAEAAAREVLCLPIYGALPFEMARAIASVIRDMGILAREGR